MKNWREEAERLLAQQQVLRDSQIRDSAAQTAEDERLTAEGRTRLSELDRALDIEQKLRAINRDVLRGLGDVEIRDVSSSSHYESGKFRNIYHRGIMLKIHSGCTIKEKTEPVYLHLKGKHIEEHRWATMEGGGTEHSRIVEVNGPYDKLTGHKLIGADHTHERSAGIGVYYRAYPVSDDAEIGIGALSPVQLKQPAVTLGTNWRVITIAGRQPSSASTLDEDKNHYFGDGHLPHWYSVEEKPQLGPSPYPLMFGDYGNGSYVEVSFPFTERTSPALSSLVDNLLLQACTSWLPNVPDWLGKKAEAQRTAASIQARIGQVYPIK